MNGIHLGGESFIMVHMGSRAAVGQVDTGHFPDVLAPSPEWSDLSKCYTSFNFG